MNHLRVPWSAQFGRAGRPRPVRMLRDLERDGLVTRTVPAAYDATI
ncbi:MULTISPECIES: hypothetical protein [Nocardia]|nr:MULTISPECIES: hypothetical protein [Nocardia]